jgi:hypothetical protein
VNSLHIITNAFTGGSCLKYHPKKFNWIFNEYPKDGSPVVYFDDSIFGRLKDGYHGPRYGWLGESSEIIPNLLTIASSNIDGLKKYYKKIFTNDRRLIEKDPSFFYYNPPSSNVPWITRPRIYEKKNLCSYITSFKSSTSGHKLRLELFQKLSTHPIFKDHIFGRDYKYLEDKIDGLSSYMFSIVIENAKYPKYYTEKVTDCFATGTIPIYFGDKSISEDFDENGIIFIEEKIDLDIISEETYKLKLESVKTNFDRVMRLKIADDCIFESINDDQAKY